MDSNHHLQGEFAAGEGSYTVAMVPPAVSVDDAYINGCFSELSFQAILTPFTSSYADDAVSFHPHQPQIVVYQPPPPPDTAPAMYSFFKHEFPATERPTTFEFSKENTKQEKQEVLTTNDLATFDFLSNTAVSDVVSGGSLINFFATSSSPNAGIGAVNGESFTHLPVLQSLEPHEAAQNGFKITGGVNSFPFQIRRHPRPSTEKKQREKISDKTRRLQKVLPWDKRMDLATMLEETHKYIRFLQAQIRVLQSMPPVGNRNPSDEIKNEIVETNEVMYGELGKLSRQQLLEVVVNSPAVQTMLYSRGCCVYSMEQLLLMKQMAEKKALEQMMNSGFQY